MLCVWWHHSSGGGAVVFAGCTVLSCALIWCAYGDTIQVEVVLLCLLVALYWVARWYGVCMVTPFKWRWCCCVCWLYCTELPVDMVCVCWHHPSGAGIVVSAGCTVLSCALIWCACGDTIQLDVVLCLLVALYWVARWYGVRMVTPFKWRWWCCVCWLYCTELPVDMLCVWWHHPNGGCVVVSAGFSMLICLSKCRGVVVIYTAYQLATQHI